MKAKAAPAAAKFDPAQDRPEPPEPADGIGDKLPVKEPAPPPSPVARGPKPATASLEERRQAVLGVLVGGEVATRLPEHAVGAGEFDPQLANKMSPIETRPRVIPRVRQLPAKVDDGLDTDIVRRIIRAHINEVRYCYSQALVEDPKASGKLTVTFEIAATGRVAKASAASKNKALDDISTCVAKAFKRWKFPKPSDGKAVQVTYPFNLTPG
ncbi:MAG: AgmX/PglI C-terminal domain-containing protein [Myxococcota bacterium]